MPTWLAILLIALAALILVLALGGVVANRRRLAATEAEFRARVEQANRDLAVAHAADRGWEPERVEAAARRAFTEQRPGEEIDRLALVQVIDRPGTEEDEAVFHVEAAGTAHRLTLGRRGDDWVFHSLLPADSG